MFCFSTKVLENRNINNNQLLCGYISSYGKKAATIKEFDTYIEWYAPLNELDEELKNMLNYKIQIPVKFKSNFKKHSGHQKSGPRYYAKNVERDTNLRTRKVLNL